MEKQCRTCFKTKDNSEFGKAKRGWLGTRNKCKACIGEYNRAYSAARLKNDPIFAAKKKEQAIAWMKANPERRAVTARKRNQKAKLENPEKISARSLVNQRVRFGRMPRACDLICSCGAQAKHYHHHMGYDFENRYNVTPVCVVCHRAADCKATA